MKNIAHNAHSVKHFFSPDFSSILRLDEKTAFGTQGYAKSFAQKYKRGAKDKPWSAKLKNSFVPQPFGRISHWR
jgi:hypothetical protein